MANSDATVTNTYRYKFEEAIHDIHQRRKEHSLKGAVGLVRITDLRQERGKWISSPFFSSLPPAFRHSSLLYFLDHNSR